MIVVVGHVLNEHIRHGERRIGPVLGGPGAYASMSVRASGADCALVSCVGRDDAAELLEPLRTAGVDIGGVLLTATTRASELSYDDAGGKSIRYIQVAEEITYAQIAEASTGASSYFICPLDFEVSLSTIERLAATDALIMTDLGGLGGAVATRHPMADSRCAEEVWRIVASSDIVKASDEDLALITGRQDPVENARIILEKGATLALITGGESGVLVMKDNDAPVHVPTYTVYAVDSTGAGDVFSGAFLSAYVGGASPVDAAIEGSAMASFIVESTGGVRADRWPPVEIVQERARVIRAQMEGQMVRAKSPQFGRALRSSP